MTRNLKDYQSEYQKQPYESYQSGFRRKVAIDILQSYPHSSLLEVGCGLSPIFLAIESFSQLTIIEPSTDFFEKALSAKTTFLEKNIELINSTLEASLPEIAGRPFDFILVASLLHEIEDCNKFLQTLHTISSLETVIHISVPNALSMHRLLALEMGIIDKLHDLSESNIRFQQARVFDINSLKAVVERNGFNVVGSGSYALKPFTHQQMQEMLDRKILTPQMLDGLYNMSRYFPNHGSEIYVNVKKNV